MSGQRFSEGALAASPEGEAADETVAVASPEGEATEEMQQQPEEVRMQHSQEPNFQRP